MKAGQLRHRITIQERSGSTWSDLFSVWAAQDQISDRERFELGDQLLQEANVIRFRVRYRSAITQDMRVVWDSRNFDIQRVEELGNVRREMRLVCLEVP